MRSFLARLPFLLQTALEKSVLALSGQYRRYPSEGEYLFILPESLPQKDVFALLSDWDEQSCPYFSPFLSPSELMAMRNLFSWETHAEILYFDHRVKKFLIPPFLKPIWSPELWLNIDLLFGAVFNVFYLKQIACQTKEKILARAVLQAKRIVRVPNLWIATSAFPWQNSDDSQQHRQTVHDYLDLLGVPLPEIATRANGSLSFRWKPSDKQVSIIIPNRNRLLFLKKCVDSIYAHTDYPNYEILVVDDHSTDPALLGYYRSQIKEKRNFRVLEGESPFNFSRACNQGARNASGEFFLFLNNDTEVLHSDWLTNLVGVARLPGVGAVGAKLIYPNGKVQHAGVVIGLEGHATHVFQGVANDPFTPYGHVDWMRNVSAVTAACMLVPKDVFWQIGGFDEQFQIAFGDIDFCLRLRDAGYRIVYTPDACLIHYEGRSRGKYIPPHDIRAKADYFLQKVAEGDPYYHPALSRAWRIPTMRWRWEQDPVGRLKKILQLYG